VVDKFVMELEMQLGERGVTIEVSEEARAWLAKKGYDRHFGARPLSRVIQEHIKRPLSEELLFGSLMTGGLVQVTVDDGKITCAFPDPEPTKPKKKTGKKRGGGNGGGPKGKDNLPAKAGRSPVPAVVK